MIKKNATRAVLLTCCVAGFFWPVFAQAVGCLVLIAIVFGPVRE